MTHSSFFLFSSGSGGLGSKEFGVHAHSGAMAFVSAVGVIEGSGKSGKDRSQSDVSVLGGDTIVEQGLNVAKICVRGEEVATGQFSPYPGMRIAEVRVIDMHV